MTTHEQLRRYADAVYRMRQLQRLKTANWNREVEGLEEAQADVDALTGTVFDHLVMMENLAVEGSQGHMPP